MSDVLSNPVVHKAVTDAQALGDELASDALVFAHTLIAHVSNAAPTEIVDVTDAAKEVFYDAIPTVFRGTVKGIVDGVTSGAVTKLDAAAEADVKKILGIATNRLETWFQNFVPTAK